MKPPIAISVVVPAYNEEKLIGKCLDSLTHQDFKLPYEIIVVDNNSTDRTAAIARQFNVSVVSEVCQNVVAARQKGSNVAHGKIVASVDCDATYPANWLRLVYETFVSNPKIVAVAGTPVLEKNPLWAFWWYKAGFMCVNFLYQLTGQVIYIGAYNFAFNRKVFTEIGGYHTYLDAGGDEFDLLRRLKHVGKVVFNPELTMRLSARRYRQGFLKSMLVDGFYYYQLNYTLARIFKQTFIRMPPVRE